MCLTSGLASCAAGKYVTLAAQAVTCVYLPLQQIQIKPQQYGCRKLPVCVEAMPVTAPAREPHRVSAAICSLQVKEDEYSKVDKELLEYVEDVLLNRRDNATERLLEYAATLEPKCKPTAVRKLGEAVSTGTDTMGHACLFLSGIR